MRKGQKVSHTKGCSNPRCRGICKKQMAHIKKARQTSDSMILFTGPHRFGKSAAAFRFFENPPNGAAYDFSAYDKLKQEAFSRSKETTEYENQHGRHWELLGRLLGMAYSEGDRAFFALLEGLNAGRTNQNDGRRALGGKLP